MVCISELRGLQDFQAKHPETVVVAMNVLAGKSAQEAVERILRKQKLEALRVASGTGWQGKFGLPDQIPMTIVVEGGKVRVVHDAVMADPVSFLEADLKALRDLGKGTTLVVP